VIVSGGGDAEPLLDARHYLPFSEEADQAIAYARWFASDGQQGQEPQGEVRQCIDLFRRIQRTADPDEQVRLFHEILRLNARNLWCIGTVVETSVPYVVKRAPGRQFRNVPDVAAPEWVFRAPGNAAPEAFCIVPTGQE
jgi:peptide/nickel transport system substrate-binding protein